MVTMICVITKNIILIYFYFILLLIRVVNSREINFSWDSFGTQSIESECGSSRQL